MKKFLALVLALVMTMSLVTVSAGAEDFTDAADITYEEAVDVMTALGVVTGDTAGAFNPTKGLTRGAAAKIICNMVLGTEVAGALEAQEAPFVDVATSNVFAGYIGFCKEEGIIGGYPDGTFKPADPLTGYAFLKMLLGALGYDADVEGFNGSNYAINVAKIAKQRGLTTGNDGYKGSAAITREEAMLYAFNTMKSQVVEYDGASNSTITIGDIVIKNNGKAEFATNDFFYEANFSKLSLQDVDAEATADDKGMMDFTANGADGYGRLAYTWYIEKTAHDVNDYDEDIDTLIGEYADAADETLVVTKAGKTLAYWLETLDKEYEVVNVTVNGAANYNTMNLGDVVEVYVDSDNDVEAVIVNKVQLKQVAKVTAVEAEDYDYTVKVGTRTYKDTDLPGFDAATMVKDTYVLVTYKLNTAEVLNIEVAPYVEGVMTAKGSGYVKVDGVKYEVVGSLPTSYENTYKFFMDNNQYVLGYELVEKVETNDGYVYVISAASKAYSGGSLGIGGNAAEVKVKVAFMDGTVKTLDYVINQAADDIAYDAETCPVAIDEDDYYIEVKGVKYEVANTMASLATGFYTYSLDEAGKIVLKDLDDDTNDADETIVASTVKKDSTTISSNYYANSATKLVVIDTTDKKAGEFVGYKNFPSTAVTASVPVLVVHAKDSKLAEVVYVIDDVTSNDVTYAYYTGDYETRGTKTYYDFYVEGALVSYELSAAPNAAYDVFTVNAEAKTATGVAFTAGIVTELDDNFFVTSASLTSQQYADTVKVWDVSVEDVVSAGEVAEGDSILYVADGDGVKAIYIVESFIKDQPETITEAIAQHDDWNAFADIVSLGLTQSVDAATIYLSGEVVAIDGVADWADIADDLNAYWSNGGVALSSFADWCANTSGAVDVDDTIGFVAVTVNGEVAILMVKDNNGAVEFVSSGSQNGASAVTVPVYDVTVTIDLTGLSF